MLLELSDISVSSKKSNRIRMDIDYIDKSKCIASQNVHSSNGNTMLSCNSCTVIDSNNNLHKDKRAQHSTEVDELIKALGCLNLNRDFWVHTASLVKSNHPIRRFEGTKQFRMMLSVSGDIPIQDVIDTGVVPCLVSFISHSMDPNLQFEAAWALTNIASGTSQQTEIVVQAGAIPNFLALVEHEKEDIREQGMWGLGNIAGDRAEFRDSILNSKSNCVECFISACEKSRKMSTIRTAVWSLSNLCRGKPRPEFCHVASAIPYLTSILAYSTDNDTLVDACWALDGLSEHSLAITDMISNGVVSLLVALLCNKDIAIQRPALRVIGQIAAGNAQQTQEVIDSGALSSLKMLLNSSRKGIRKDACWTLSNIAAGSPQQLQELLKEEIMISLINIFYSDTEPEVRRESAWAICNACTSHVEEQLQYLVSTNCLKPLCDMLLLEDFRVVEVALEAIDHLLNFGEKIKPSTSHSNICYEFIKKTGGFNNIYHLCKNSHDFDNFKICQLSSNIMNKWFQNCFI